VLGGKKQSKNKGMTNLEQIPCRPVGIGRKNQEKPKRIELGLGK